MRELYDEIMRELRDAYQNGYPEVPGSEAWPWAVGFSAGKDSTLLLQIIWEMLLDLAPSDRRREVCVIANDTLVESPVYAAFMRKRLDQLAHAAEALDVPIRVVRTTPAPDQTFWVNLIGRGYPAPNRLFRWCTDRMKIRPAAEILSRLVGECGGVVLFLGVRRAESVARAATAALNDARAVGRLNLHHDVDGCWIARPILEMTTEDVWTVLLQRRPPWGGSHRDLVTLYRNAGGGECPFVVDQDAAAGCGTGSARFGCWTCTVVEKDKSAEGLLDAGFDHIEPLVDFRAWLREYSADPANRLEERRNGGPGIGGLTMDAREEILRRLREAERESGLELLSAEEMREIEWIWDAEPSRELLRKAKRALRILSDPIPSRVVAGGRGT